MNGSRYTIRQAAAECQWEIAVVWGCAALGCVLLTIGKVPWIANAVTTALLGPVGSTGALLARVHNKRRQR